MSKFNFSSNPKSSTMEDRFVEPDSFENELGDGTVLAAASIAPGIKWAWEFDNDVPNSKPVNFIEMCSEYK
jgi:hypothetical protein